MKDQFDGVDFDETAFVSASVPFFNPSTSTTTYFYQQHLKPCFDLLVSLMLLPLLLPVTCVLWVAASKGGAGLYYQNRIGKNGVIFGCYKLRTMKENADEILTELCASDAAIATEWRINQKLKDDPRITNFGRFLRSTSLDELPQIWNVIRGDMSLVGPRPFMEDQEAIYRAAGGHAYYDLRPRITGYWQTEGRGTTSFVSRISFDNAYRNQMSFWGDIGLILKTVKVLFNRTGH